MAYKCPLCGRTHQLKQEMIDHVENNHADEMPKDMSTAQWLYLEAHNGNPGVCRYCGKPTLWNEKLGKYKQVCDSPACKAKVRKQYEERMMKSFGRIDVANDPELQKKMLANKKISGVYVWSDGRHKFTYTGSYEHSLIEWLDKVMDVDPETIQMPGVVIDYEMNGEKHFWITDLYLSDYNLVIEVKDGMENTHPGFAPNRAKEKAKDDYMRTQSQYNYLKLTHKNPLQLIKILSEIRMNNILGTDDKKDTKLIQINEAANSKESTGITLADFDNDLVYSLCEAISSNYEETAELQAALGDMPGVTCEKTKDQCDTLKRGEDMIYPMNEDDLTADEKVLAVSDGKGHVVGTVDADGHGKEGLRGIDYANEETDCGCELRSDVDSDTEHFHTTGALSFIAHDVLNSSLKCTD